MNVDFGERLKAERKKIGLNQADFAALGGVSRNSQTEYETGKTPPNADYLARLAGHGVDVAYLLTGNRGSDSLSQDEGEIIEAVRRLNFPQRQALSSMLEAFTTSTAILAFHDPKSKFMPRPPAEDENRTEETRSNT